MRFASFMSAVLALPFLFAADPACNGPVCSCPSSTGWPSVFIELSCGSIPLPTLTLSGVCAGQGGEQSGQLVFGSFEPGTCHVELHYEDGAMFSTDVTFTGEWLQCGSDPHGCGQFVSPVGLSMLSPGSWVLTIGPTCEGGVSETPDAASE